LSVIYSENRCPLFRITLYSSNSENIARVMRQPRGFARTSSSVVVMTRFSTRGAAGTFRNGGGQCASRTSVSRDEESLRYRALRATAFNLRTVKVCRETLPAG